MVSAALAQIPVALGAAARPTPPATSQPPRPPVTAEEVQRLVHHSAWAKFVGPPCSLPLREGVGRHLPFIATTSRMTA